MSQTEPHVVIIGAGIVGVATAIWAQREGFSVTLVDRAEPGEGASYGNAGLLASAAIVPVTVPGLLRKAPRMALDPQESLFIKWSYLLRIAPWLWRYLGQATSESATYRARAILPLIGDSLADHQALAAGTGAEHRIVRCDYLAGYRSRAAFESDAFGWNLRREAGFGVSELDRDAIESYDPGIGPAIGYAARVDGHGRITDPGDYVKLLAHHAEAQGVRLIKAEVQTILSENGKVKGVRAAGQTIACDKVVVTSGVWSGPLAQALGLKVPLAPESGFHLELWEPNMMPRSPMMIAQGKFVMTPMEGRLRLAGMVGYQGLEAEPPEAPYRLFENHIKSVLPGISWRKTQRWMGHRPAMVDSCPMIGEVPGVSGAFVGFGHDHVGLTAGPRTGKILAQLMAGSRPNVDLKPFTPERFG